MNEKRCLASGMPIPTETLLDVSLLLTDARGVLFGLLGDPARRPWSVQTRLPADTRDQLALSVRRLAADPTLSRALAEALAAFDTVSAGRLLWFQADFEVARTALEAVDEVTNEVHRRLALAGDDGWRPLEVSDAARAGLQRSTRRASYSRNIAAG